MTCITPEIGYPCMSQARWDRGFFRDPYPLTERFYLVAHAPGPKRPPFGIYVLDRWGNRAELYSDEKLSCLEPIPLRPRRKPMKVASVLPTGAKKKTGTLFVQDVYDGMTGIERGRVKCLRVMSVMPWPWQEDGTFRIGMAGNVHRKKVLGVVKVEADGSACFEVPTEENVFFQALDENFMMLQHMPTFINVMPGEYRSCIGCHEPRRKAPPAKLALALRRPPQTIQPQPGDKGPRMVHYTADVQPILDKHCIQCHSGPNPKGHLDLTGEWTQAWNRSYENIFGRGLVSQRDCRYGRAGFRPAPPLSFGSHRSELVEHLRAEPCRSGITREEFIRIVTWIDANVPFYGTYRGKRDIKHKDDPDFRPPPAARRKKTSGRMPSLLCRDHSATLLGGQRPTTKRSRAPEYGVLDSPSPSRDQPRSSRMVLRLSMPFLWLSSHIYEETVDGGAWALARFLHRNQLPGEKEKNALADNRPRLLAPERRRANASRSLCEAFFSFSPTSGTHGAQKRAKAHSPSLLQDHARVSFIVSVFPARAFEARHEARPYDLPALRTERVGARRCLARGRPTRPPPRAARERPALVEPEPIPEAGRGRHRGLPLPSLPPAIPVARGHIPRHGPGAGGTWPTSAAAVASARWRPRLMSSSCGSPAR